MYLSHDIQFIGLISTIKATLGDASHSAEERIRRAEDILEAVPLGDSRHTPPRGGLAPWQTRRLRLLIAERLSLPITCREMAGWVGLSTAHFSRAFRTSVKVTPHAYVMRARVERACSQSRARVKDLRQASSAQVSLSEAVAAEGEQMALTYPAQFKVSADAEPRPLHPIVREEALLIAREALFNAFRHAKASHIEADVYYGATELIVRIRDDGVGMDSEVPRAGSAADHFGLLGMRERAGKISARLEIWSTPGAGTEIDLRIPASVAYSETLKRRR